MAALSVDASCGIRAAPCAHRFASTEVEGTRRWLLDRHCSTTPSRLLGVYVSLCALSLAIAAAFWWQGAPFVLPFAGIEMFVVGALLLAHARHAADRERLELASGRLRVERTIGTHTDRTDFASAWARVAARREERALIDIVGEGKRVAIGRWVPAGQRGALADELRFALRAEAAAARAPDRSFDAA